MANGLFEANIIGNLTREPEVKEWQGTPYAVFTVAVNTYVRGQEEVCYVDCSLWGKPVDGFMRNARKGAEVFINGSLRLKEYEYKGETRQKLTINTNTYRLLGISRSQDERPAPQPQQQPRKQAQYTQANAEDIPF